jgi:predicted RNase H-like nuclease (RuvC/YqgF family)
MNVGAGDIIVLSTLAFKCYRSCKESSEQFKWVATEVRNLRCALDEVRESMEEYQPLSPTRQDRVNTGVRECEGSLRELEAELDRYQSLYTQDQRLHDKVKFAAKNVANLRDRIKAQTTNLEMLSFAIQR